MATKRQSYTTSEKLKIIQFAEEHGNRAAQREFGIAESNVRLWRKSKENLQKMPRLQRADRRRKKKKESPDGCLDMRRRRFQAETAGYFQTQNHAQNCKQTWRRCCCAAEGMDG